MGEERGEDPKMVHGMHPRVGFPDRWRVDGVALLGVLRLKRWMYTEGF